MSISSDGNKYLQEQKAWELIKTDRVRCGTVIGVAVNLIHTISLLIEPYMPAVATSIQQQLNYAAPTYGALSGQPGFELHLPAEHTIGTPEVLFRRIEEKEIAELRARFGGKQETKMGEEFPIEIVGEETCAVCMSGVACSCHGCNAYDHVGAVTSCSC